LFQAFRPDPHPLETIALTLRTTSWCRDAIITIMASKRMILQMMGEGYTAVGAFEGEPTIRTKNKMSKPPAIEKQEALLFLFRIFLEGRLYLL
jgi:hypothetical protein